MAVLADPRFRSVNDLGAVYVGATLTVYVAGTTTPANIFRDAALTQAMTNPTTGADKSNSHGFFPQVFAAEGSTFDIVCKDASAVTLWSLVNVPAVGAGSDDITRDFGAGGRFDITGAGGIIQIRAGPPSGDDIGGSLKLTGEAATQLDDLTLDALTTNTTGTFTENSKKLPGIVQTAAGASSGAATVIIPLPNVPANCRQYEIDIIDIHGSTSGNTTLTVSTDNGATYVAAGYYSAVATTSRASVDITGSNNAASAVVAQVNALVAGVATLTVTTPVSTGRAFIQGTVYADCILGGLEEAEFSRFNVVTASLTARVTHIKLTFPATVACTYRVLPQRGFGE